MRSNHRVASRDKPTDSLNTHDPSTSNRGTGAIPQEIIDSIIDLLESTKTLQACSLASRAFYPRTRVRLFRHISLCPPRNQSPDILEAHFLPILMSAPHLAPCVKTVFISTLMFTSPSGKQILPLLSHLETIVISNLSNSPWKDLAVDVCSNIPAKRVMLSDVQFKGPEQLYSLLGHFPLTKDLTLRAVSFQNPLDPSNSSSVLDLEKLALADGPMPHFLSSFCNIHNLRVCPALRELRVSVLWFEDYFYTLYISHACPTLRVLHVISPQDMIFWKPVPALGLSYIEELRFGICVEASPRRSDVRAMQWWIDSFADVEDVAPLRKVTLEIRGNIVHGSDEEDLWSELDRAATRPQFSSLQTFTVIFHCSEDIDDWHACKMKDLIWTKCTEMRNRKVLKVMGCQLELSMEDLREYERG
ncbi:uncharacterized protein ARMOST_15734 [Armillaria ostoyae]|uniref:F-box domain-containing protein n=1 Tax=Armillaria ostoyae TaxID=47428 RepID=A0A284RU69_ARMOS|nr:uncharacterized protein ARMOST_15734 [Armillaria ostoyae]